MYAKKNPGLEILFFGRIAALFGSLLSINRAVTRASPPGGMLGITRLWIDYAAE
jgi:hypothetical protein